MGKKSHGNQKIAVERAVGVWVHRESRLGAQMGSVLEPNTNAQRMLLLSHLLHWAMFACVCDCYSFLCSLWWGVPVPSSCHTFEWVMSHIWMSCVTYMHESCHTYEWVVSHIWMSRVTRMNESCHTYECVMSQIWMSHVTHMNEWCHVYEWVMSHTWIRHVTHTNESCHKYIHESCHT